MVLTRRAVFLFLFHELSNRQTKSDAGIQAVLCSFTILIMGPKKIHGEKNGKIGSQGPEVDNAMAPPAESRTPCGGANDA